MKSIAAYYVLVASDLATSQRPPAYAVTVRRPSILAHVTARLGSLGFGRSTAAQAA